MPESSAEFGFNTPFAEQLAFFRQKLNLPTERWDDIKRAAHDRGFIVAGAAKADLLTDLRAAMDKAIVKGMGMEEFRKDFRKTVEKTGWTGWTGEGTKGGEAWRTRVIYQTNMATSYAAGRWRQLNEPDMLSLRPFWRYIHNDSQMHPRPLHLRWGTMRLTLRHDHPFWKTHFPPNGWGCECRVKAVRGPEAGDSTAPPDGWDSIDPKTGAPVGIDKGFDYAPGANAQMPLRQMVQDKLVSYPPAITKALSKDVNRYINGQEVAADFARGVLSDRQREDPLCVGFVETFEAVGQILGRDLKGFMVLIPADAPRHIDRAHAHDGKGQRPVLPEDYQRIEHIVNAFDHAAQGHDSTNELPTVVMSLDIAGEIYRAVFEIRSGKRNRALALKSLVIKR